MMRALIGGVSDPALLAEMARGRMRPKIAQLTKALTVGRFDDHHRVELARLLDLAERLDSDINSISARIAEHTAEWETQIRLLVTIPGVDRRSAEVILAEIGPDMSVFPTAEQLASWAGLCPGQNESAGRSKSAKIRKGDKWLRATLIQCARAATRTNNTYLQARYRQLRGRRGDGKTIVAIAHNILTTAWWLLTTGTTYTDPGPATVTNRTADTTRRRAIRQLEALGYNVNLTAVA